jgi:hypothetical protein
MKHALLLKGRFAFAELMTVAKPGKNNAMACRRKIVLI